MGVGDIKLFHLLMHSLVYYSCMCPDRGSNVPPWCTGMVLQPAELPGQGSHMFLQKFCNLLFIELKPDVDFCHLSCLITLEPNCGMRSFHEPYLLLG